MNAKKGNVFKVEGSQAISGEIRIQGNKNEALPALATCLLTEDSTQLSNIPNIQDVIIMLDVLKEIGVSVKAKSKTEYQIQASTLQNHLPKELCRQLRGAVTLAGPLLARHKEIFLPRPGGDRIGRRRLDTHFLAFEAMGAKIKTYPDGFEITCLSPRGTNILLDEASVTATENAICLAVLAEGKTTIRNAASEPHVQGICRMLNTMGAKIKGIGSNILSIEGVKKLRGTQVKIAPDYLEAGSFIALSAITGGELRIKDLVPEDLEIIQMTFSRLGIHTFWEKEDLIVPQEQSLEVSTEIGGSISQIHSAPWPGFPADMTSVALVTASQCKGTVMIHEKMFESRLFFTDHLISMGAKIILCDPHRAIVIGPSPLQGTKLTSPDIRAGMAMLIASLVAKGTSYIHNIYQIDRGFSHLEERLQSLGANISRK